MVKIVGFKERTSKDGVEFLSLEVQGGVEMIHSKSGQLYATAKTVSIPSTFDAETCRALVGTDMPGRIEKRPCRPYEHTIKKTGEVVTLEHTYEYLPEEEGSEPDVSIEADHSLFSSNGVHQEV